MRKRFQIIHLRVFFHDAESRIEIDVTLYFFWNFIPSGIIKQKKPYI